MVYLFKDTRVYIFLIIWASLGITPTKAHILNIANSHSIAKFVRSLVQPFVQSFLINSTGQSNSSGTADRTTMPKYDSALNSKNYIRANPDDNESKAAPSRMQLQFIPSKQDISEIPMLQFIQNKVDILKPFLDDDSVPEHDGLRLEGDEETTIIEFVPNIVSKNPKNKRSKGDVNEKVDHEQVMKFQSKIYKYKKMRNKIRKALKTENITKTTKEMVTKSIDKMIAHMNAHKCKWADDNDMAGPMRGGSVGKSPPEKLVEKWNVLWDAVKQNISKNTINLTAPKNTNEQQKFLTKFQELVSLLTNEMNHFVSKYKIVCRFSENHDERSIKTDDKNVGSHPILKSIKQNYNDNQLLCAHFQLCSEELTDFLYKFYINLNSSAVSVIENYASMFLRDVSDDGYHEKERIVDMIIKICKVFESKVNILFRKEMLKLELDYQRNQNSNMKILYKLIRKTIASAKKQVLKELESGLATVRHKVMDTIKRDIEVNFNSEMALLENAFNERMCPTFNVCNGRIYMSRKAVPYLGYRNNVFVKVKHESDEIQESSKETDSKQADSIHTRSPKIYVTRTAPKIARLGSKKGPATTKVEEGTSSETHEKTDKNDVDSSFNKSNHICPYRGKNERKAEIHHSECIFNAHARKIQNEIETNLIAHGSHDIELLNPDKQTPTARQPPSKTKHTINSKSHNEGTEITKTGKRPLLDNIKARRKMKMRRKQWDNLLENIKRTREKMSAGIDILNTVQRNMIVYK